MIRNVRARPQRLWCHCTRFRWRVAFVLLFVVLLMRQLWSIVPMLPASGRFPHVPRSAVGHSFMRATRTSRSPRLGHKRAEGETDPIRFPVADLAVVQADHHQPASKREPLQPVAEPAVVQADHHQPASEPEPVESDTDESESDGEEESKTTHLCGATLTCRYHHAGAEARLRIHLVLAKEAIYDYYGSWLDTALEIGLVTCDRDEKWDQFVIRPFEPAGDPLERELIYFQVGTGEPFPSESVISKQIVVDFRRDKCERTLHKMLDSNRRDFKQWSHNGPFGPSARLDTLLRATRGNSPILLSLSSTPESGQIKSFKSDGGHDWFSDFLDHFDMGRHRGLHLHYQAARYVHVF